MVVFTLLCLREIGLIFIKEMKEVNEGIFFYTTVKSEHNKYTPIFIPKVENILFCWTNQLVETTRHKLNISSSYLFITTRIKRKIHNDNTDDDDSLQPPEFVTLYKPESFPSNFTYDFSISRKTATKRLIQRIQIKPKSQQKIYIKNKTLSNPTITSSLLQIIESSPSRKDTTLSSRELNPDDDNEVFLRLL
jgi:hypothetical protein